ncbi:MAG: hypothetical protein ACQETE_02275 [Bacteroidota bacterium]
MALRLLALVSVVLFLGLTVSGVSPEVAFLRAAIVFAGSVFIYRIYLALAGVIRGQQEDEESEEADSDQTDASESATASSSPATEAEPKNEFASASDSSQAQTEATSSNMQQPATNGEEPSPSEGVTPKDESGSRDDRIEPGVDDGLRDEAQEMAGTPEAAEVVREIMEERSRDKEQRRRQQEREEQGAYS